MHLEEEVVVAVDQKKEDSRTWTATAVVVVVAVRVQPCDDGGNSRDHPSNPLLLMHKSSFHSQKDECP
jgi:hypothetical protein